MKYYCSIFLFITSMTIMYTWTALSCNTANDFETEYICDKESCLKGFATEREFLFHMLCAHICKEKIVCPFKKCTRSYEKEKYLDEHLNREHRIFICNFCKDEIQYHSFDEFKIHLREKHIAK